MIPEVGRELAAQGIVIIAKLVDKVDN